MEKETRVSKEFVEQELNEKEPTPISLHYICMSVLARNILSPRPFSLWSYVCIGLPRPAHPPKVKYSLSARTNKGKANGVQAIRQNISLWEGMYDLTVFHSVVNQTVCID